MSQQNTRHSTSPIALARTVSRNQGLIRGLVVREVVGRYKGSVMGLMWSFFTPIMMLAVFTFVFSYVFNARWGTGTGSKTEFALVLFAGLMAFNLFAECCNRAPLLVTGNLGYVKKVVFPLEVLPVVSLAAGVFHFFVSFAVWFVFHLMMIGLPPATFLLTPLAVLPLVLMALGFSWLLASLGVYLRDVAQVVGSLTLVLLYLSPIFYPISVMPEQYQAVMRVSPLTSTVEQMRGLMMWGHGFDWRAWGISMGVALLIAWLGFAWFQKTRKGFADVL
uniref:ABC transporter permease n=1 Tax=Luteimonas sp. BLCC-B24 TaxID=3025317 RepID=UPI00234E32A9|nr:ABC transporter permease [Luteimonas sp. BLCC-B24]MDC7807935.1 ABC transporter permease [Luteimonas sp. BLCC-B24]